MANRIRNSLAILLVPFRGAACSCAVIAALACMGQVSMAAEIVVEGEAAGGLPPPERTPQDIALLKAIDDELPKLGQQQALLAHHFVKGHSRFRPAKVGLKTPAWSLQRLNDLSLKIDAIRIRTPAERGFLMMVLVSEARNRHTAWVVSPDGFVVPFQAHREEIVDLKLAAPKLPAKNLGTISVTQVPLPPNTNFTICLQYSNAKPTLSYLALATVPHETGDAHPRFAVMLGVEPTDIFQAIRLGHEKAIANCVAADPASLHRIGFEGQTPLSYAGYLKDPAMVRKLLDLGAMVDARNDKGLTPLWVAAQRNGEYAVEELLKWGADVNAVDERGWTPMHAAAEQECSETILFLGRHGADKNRKAKNSLNPLAIAIDAGKTFSMDALSELDADMEQADDGGWRALHRAARQGSANFLAAVLSKKPDLEARNRSGDTPLIVALSFGQLDATTVLLAHGAKLDAKTGRGATPLHAAAHGGSVECLELLFQKGAGVGLETKSDDGETPLHFAAALRHRAAVEYLLAKGANPQVKNNGGATPVDYWNAAAAEFAKKTGAQQKFPASPAKPGAQ